MAPGDPVRRRATLADYVAAEEEGLRVELIDGVIVQKELGGKAHAGGQSGVHGALYGPFRGRSGGDRPGGWTFLTEASIWAPNGDIVQPDIAGWRRERAPTTDEFPIAAAPDWACEVAYTSHARDLQYKPPVYRLMGVGHYWILDMKAMVLSVYRLTADGYVLVTAVGPRGRVRLEPFDAVELAAWELFGLEDEPETP